MLKRNGLSNIMCSKTGIITIPLPDTHYWPPIIGATSQKSALNENFKCLNYSVLMAYASMVMSRDKTTKKPWSHLTFN